MVETKSVKDSVMAPTANVAVEGEFEEGKGGDPIEVTVPWALVEVVKLLLEEKLVPDGRERELAELDRILLSRICCFMAEGVMG